MSLPICTDLRDYADAFGDGYPALAGAAGTIEELYDALDDLIARCDANIRPGGGSMVPPSARKALDRARSEPPQATVDEGEGG